MKKHLVNAMLAPLLLGLVLAPQVYGAESHSGRDIMQMVDDRPDGDDGRAVMHMTLINHRGSKRERTLQSYRKDYGKDSKVLMFFEKPADVQGVGFLSWEHDAADQDDDRWLYMPALRKARRIAGESKNDYFMGSDFTYDDMGDRAVDEDNHKLLREETLDGHPCWVVESVPKGSDEMYSRCVSWIRQDALMPVKVEYYDLQHKLLKTLAVNDIRLEQGIWTAFRMEMQNVQQEHRTILAYDSISYDNGLKDDIFKVNSLRRGKVR